MNNLKELALGESVSSIKKEIDELSKLLNSNEKVDAIFYGVPKGKLGNHLVAMTKDKIFILYKGLTNSDQIILNLENVSAVQAKTGMIFGTLSISTPSDNFIFENGSKKLATNFAQIFSTFKSGVIVSRAEEIEQEKSDEPITLNENKQTLDTTKKKEAKSKVGKIAAAVLVLLMAIGYITQKEPTPEELAERQKIAQEKEQKEKEVKEQEQLNEIANMDLAAYAKASDSKKIEILKFLIEKSSLLNEHDLENVRLFMSEMSQTKNENLKITDVFTWAENEKKNNPKKFSEHVDLLFFMKDFSAWDGSYRPLEKLIKQNMNDPDSYDHSKTMYSFVLHSDKKSFSPYANVSTEFRGKNAFGGVVKQIVKARVDLKTLDLKIVEVIQ